jgi:hypothetical protein
MRHSVMAKYKAHTLGILKNQEYSRDLPDPAIIH